MCTHKGTAIGLAAAVLLAACTTPSMGPQASPQGLNLGRAVTADEIKAWDISIPPSGAGLPPGSGSVKQGAAVYAAKCEACHGASGAGLPAQYPRLAGQYAEYTEAQLKAFRSGERRNDANKMMQAVAAKMSDPEILAVADYIAGLR